MRQTYKLNPNGDTVTITLTQYDIKLLCNILNLERNRELSEMGITKVVTELFRDKLLELDEGAYKAMKSCQRDLENPAWF